MIDLSNLDKNIGGDYSECIERMINDGDYEILEGYLGMLEREGVMFKKTLMTLIEEKRNKMNRIKEKYITMNGLIETIQPIVKWKENAQYVFLQIVYSNTTDESLLCNQLENAEFDLVSDSNHIHFEGYCNRIDNGQRIRIIFDAFLNDNLNRLMSIYKDSKQENGRYSVTLRKKISRLWEKLYKNEESITDNIIHWDNNDSVDFINIGNS